MVLIRWASPVRLRPDTDKDGLTFYVIGALLRALFFVQVVFALGAG
jgi:hypothetical protein